MDELLALLERYIITRENDRDLYYRIKDNCNLFKDFLEDKLGYNLLIHRDFIKLEKIPGDPQPWMGIKGFSDIKEYIFFMLLIVYLEDKNKEDQFILSYLTEFISDNYKLEKIEWTSYSNRKSLVKVIKLALELCLIKVTDGNEDEFMSSEDIDVLYENTGISKYIVCSFSKDIKDVGSIEELLKYEIEGIEGLSDEKGKLRSQRVYRKLLLSPVVYDEGSQDVDYEYIKKYRSSIEENFEKYLSWRFHIHKNGAMIVLDEKNYIKDVFPNTKGESAVVLLLSKLIRDKIEGEEIKLENNDEIILTKESFSKLLLDLKKSKASGFVKALRDAKDEQYVEAIKSFMKEFLMVKEDEDNIIIMPLIGKNIGKYPDDYEVDASE